MRSDALPNKRSVGTRSNSTTSSSMDMQAWNRNRDGHRGRTRRPEPISRHQLVATGFRDQDLGVGGVFLDLLPQPVDMRLQCVRGDARIITPHFLKQRLARDGKLAGAVQE